MRFLMALLWLDYPGPFLFEKLFNFSISKSWEESRGYQVIHKGLNNRAENSHQPTRLREKKMRRFKSAKHAQRFLSAFGPIAGHFQPRRHRLRAREYRPILQGRFQQWNEITEATRVA
jgi:hypothetical protein